MLMTYQVHYFLQRTQKEIFLPMPIFNQELRASTLALSTKILHHTKHAKSHLSFAGPKERGGGALCQARIFIIFGRKRTRIVQIVLKDFGKSKKIQGSENCCPKLPNSLKYMFLIQIISTIVKNYLILAQLPSINKVIIRGKGLRF